MEHVDVIVVGGGHAGTEAADATARRGASVALVTLKRESIGVMSCNPAFGGLGKGHLVREIDALDGVMGRAADKAGIQFRLLNRKKGPAVQGPRAQADRALYQRAVQDALSGRQKLRIIEGEVVDLVVQGGEVEGVVLADGAAVRAKSVVLTTGTFLRGVIHVGDRSFPAGRMGEKPSVRLADRLDSFGLPLGRLKTGTPPRLRASSIDWDILEKQPGDSDPQFFSFLTESTAVPQIACGITHTNERTHEIIRDNLHRSAMYGGMIEGVGPRYCPSIEDKVVRFSDKPSHQIFLEPEGLESDLVYPNGISTSLPEDVQEEYVRSICGLERAEIVQPGYAIEYDYVDPRALRHSHELREVPGLFLAGQINGTTGYEEAGAQGLVAGLNAAARALGLQPAQLDRANSYIGVMIDDLVTRGVSEPYRMFTSRAEFRLSLRADNADQRLTPLGVALGCVDEDRRRKFERKAEALDKGKKILANIAVSSRSAARAGIRVAPDGPVRTGADLLALTDVDFDDVIALAPEANAVPEHVRRQLKNDALYAHYIARQDADIAALKKDEAVRIPDGFDFGAIRGLSNELREKLESIRPATLAQAGRIEGMTPAALTVIFARLRASTRDKAS